jgi:hypothetical protein
MSQVAPIQKEWRIHRNIDEVNSALVKALKAMNGRVKVSGPTLIQCDFGSLVQSRLFGEFWVSRETLPKRAEIHLEPLGESETGLKLMVKDTHKYGFKAGYVNKYRQALQELADSIYRSVQEGQ